MAKRSKTKASQRDSRRAPATSPGRKDLGGPWNPSTLAQSSLIMLAVLWVFWPTLHGDWLWDDPLYLTANPLMQDPWRLLKAWFEPGSFIEYYPITESLQWLQWQCWHSDTFGYHLTNIILHLISALLLWRVLDKLGLKFAWLGGLLFAIHPANVESVAWISEFKNTLSLPPFLLAIGAWIDFEENRKPRDYWLALGFFVVAMLCKISASPFPAVILLYGWWKRGKVGWRDLWASTPFFLISVVLIAATIWSGQLYLRPSTAPVDPIPFGGLFSKLALAGETTLFYLTQFFWPVHLSVTYSQWSISPLSVWMFLPWITGMGAFFWFWMRRESWGRHALLGFGFFVLTIAPFVGFIGISYMSFTWVLDHFLYLPMIGLIGLVVAAGGDVWARIPKLFQAYGLFVVVLVLGLLSWESHLYAGTFINEEAVWTNSLRNNPQSWNVHNSLGTALLSSNQVPSAITEYEIALSLRPDYTNAEISVGNALAKEGQFPEAIEHFKRAVKISPQFAEAHMDLANILLIAGHVTEAIDHYTLAAPHLPHDAGIHQSFGIALIRANRFTEAVPELSQALAIDSNNAVTHNALGFALQQTGHLTDAREEYEQALKLDPANTLAQNNLLSLQNQSAAASVKH